MSWDNISKSLGSVIEERVSNPLVTTFAISWSIINWKFFVLLFSKNTATDTFRLIHEICFPTTERLVGQGFLAPLVVTIAYVYLLPPASLWFFKAWKKAQNDIDLVRDQYDREQRLPLAKSQELRRKNAELEGTVDELKETLRVSKADLRAASVALEEEKAKSASTDVLNSKLTDLHSRLAATQTQLQEELTKKDGYLQLLEQRDDSIRTLRAQLDSARTPLNPSSVTPEVLSGLFPNLSFDQLHGILQVLRGQSKNRLLELLDNSKPKSE